MANATLSQPLPKHHYFVACDSKLPNGGTLLAARLSRRIERVGVLLRVLKRVRRYKSTAYAVEVRQFR